VAQHSKNRSTGQAQAKTSQAQAKTGFSSWTRERKIYLAVGILASLAGLLIIALSR